MAEAPWRPQGPPTPPVLSGNIPATRLKNEIGERRNEPPACVQNAMMTKDKKPFTYTPGGIDLSEIKSPRMARRIERNANAPGVGELPPGYMQNQQQNRILPPSALAAMQPQLPVQVFPAGIPPPPPPPPLNAPTSVAMPPLPTKTVASSDGVFERPDMTQIIPENPMALLRKTPKVDRKTFLDELTEMERKNPAQHIQQASTRQPNNQQPLSPQPTLYPTKPQTQNYPQIQNQVPFCQSPYPTQTPITPQMQSSPQTPQYNRQLSYTTQPQPYSSQTQEQYYSQPPVALMAQQSMCDASPLSPPTKTSNVNIGSLYIPPINQQSRPQQYKPPSPPTPPQRQPQSPQTPQSPIPKLNAAPKPWQQQRREPELPEWAQRPQQSPPKDETVQSAKVSVQPPRVTPLQMPPPPARAGIEVVYVTQPEVYQHPGPNSGQRWVPPQVQQQVQRQQQQCMPSGMKGTRIIPIHIEGQSSGPSSPATPERNFNRQSSWTPTQSKSFKVIQKMNAEDEEMQVEHAPRTSQQFPADQFRRIDLQDNDKEFTNRVNQASQNSSQHRGNHIRTIPIQIEGDLQQHYVHPSQQTVEEPRKYMGSSIPSPAFRMVHAMSNSPGPGQSDI